jgi:toxin YoeB
VRLTFTERSWEDYLHWVETDRQMFKRVNRLIADTLRNPTEGIGKPEMLKHLLAGAWSRRIDDEHRLVYLVDGDRLVIVQARYHY